MRWVGVVIVAALAGCGQSAVASDERAGGSDRPAASTSPTAGPGAPNSEVLQGFADVISGSPLVSTADFTLQRNLADLATAGGVRGVVTSAAASPALRSPLADALPGNPTAANMRTRGIDLQVRIEGASIGDETSVGRDITVRIPLWAGPAESVRIADEVVARALGAAPLGAQVIVPYRVAPTSSVVESFPILVSASGETISPLGQMTAVIAGRDGPSVQAALGIR